ERNWFRGDSLAKYVYRVSPLCESIKLHIWQFGSLPSSDERQYISEMVKERKNALSPSVQELYEKELITITDQLCISQEFIRQKLQDVAVVSLRDVERCLTFFIWILNHFYKEITVSTQIQYSLVVSMGLCYYFRLNENDRIQYNSAIKIKNSATFKDILYEEVGRLCKTFSYPSGTFFL
ncbi:ring finger protein, partial [Reticulomyxa filosa]